MQWIIDILAAKVIAEIGVPPCFIDRGDFGAFDWSLPALISDGVFRTLDISAIVPIKTKGILFTAQLVNAGVQKGLLLRPHPTSGVANFSALVSQVANVSSTGDLVIAIGPARTFQYSLSPGGWLVVDFAVKGWWL